MARPPFVDVTGIGGDRVLVAPYAEELNVIMVRVVGSDPYLVGSTASTAELSEDNLRQLFLGIGKILVQGGMDIKKELNELFQG